MSDRLKELREKALSLPLTPGVYIMKDGDGKIIYIPIYMMGALCKSLVGEREQASNEGIDEGSDENPWNGFS